MYTKKIYFSGGDFHELQAVFTGLPGVVATQTGYLRGEGNDDEVHGIEVEYNPKKVDLSMLMDILFAVVTPYRPDGQGKAIGKEFRAGVWYTDAEEPVSFTYEIVGDAGEPYWFSASELEPSDAGLNVYVDALTIRSDGEYQLTVENPWVDADYASSDEGVATVSDDGKIWAVAPGEATITVTQGGETAEVVVTVVE